MMGVLLAFVPAVLVVLVVIGLIDPKRVLWWTERPSRFKVIGYGILLFVAFGTIQSMYSTLWTPTPTKQATISKNTSEISAGQTQKAVTKKKKPQGYTTTSQDLHEASRAVKKILAAANGRAEKSIFKSFEITSNGRIIYIIISDDWYYAKDYVKERLAKFIGKQVTYIAADTKISYKNGKFSRPIIWFKDTHGEALAHGVGASWEIEK